MDRGRLRNGCCSKSSRPLVRHPFSSYSKTVRWSVLPALPPLATVIIYDRRTIAQLILDPDFAFGEGYAEGRIQVIGDLTRALEVVYRSWPSGRAARSWYGRLASAVMDWAARQSRWRA